MLSSFLRQKMSVTTRSAARTVPHGPSQALKKSAHQAPVDALIERFKQLTVEEIKPVVFKRKEDKPFKGVFFQKRHYCTSIYIRKKPDVHHLNEFKQIKEEILAKRRQFLEEHHLLQDEMLYLNRTVYANRHLYNVNQKDVLNRTNLERMLSGLCPVDLTGKDIIIIHHFDQTMLGPWVILTNVFHRDESEQLHSYIVVKGRVNRKQFGIERSDYWKFEAQNLLKSNPQFNVRSAHNKK